MSEDIKTATDKEVIERCAAAGINWLEPDDEEGGFPGSFDMASMEQMRAVLSASASNKKDNPAIDAINSALLWDKNRNYIMPYIVRDALRKVISERALQALVEESERLGLYDASAIATNIKQKEVE